MKSPDLALENLVATDAALEQTPEQKWRSLSVELLNELFAPLSFEERLRQLYRFFPEGEVLLTSSFGTKSAYLLQLISEIRPTQPVYFIDTTYHFKETIQYKEALTQKLGLNVIDLLPHAEENKMTREEEWWRDHPRMCCAINKVSALEPVKAAHKVWISGLMSHQTEFRSQLRIFEQQGDILKFHPLIDMDEGEWLYRMGIHQLPSHPLEALGFGSIGCEPCTQPGEGRNGRWQGKRSECGLHPNYFINKKQNKVSQ